MSSNNPNFVSADLVSDPYLASRKYEILVDEIMSFQADLDQNHEIGIQLASFGFPVLMAVEEIGYQNPDLLYFYGKVKGEEAQLIQHVTQLNFLLVAVQKADANAPPRRIGFASPTED